jgi:hypothetical protein
MLPSASLTASAATSRVFGAESSWPASLLCMLRTHQSPVNGNTRYRPACSLWPCGTCTRWTPSRGFTVSSSVPPLPRFAQRDNNVGLVKFFLSVLFPSLRRVVLFAFVDFSHRRPRLVRNLSLCRERDAQPSGRRSTSRHVLYRAVPRTNPTLRTANTPNHSATSSTTGSEAGICKRLRVGERIYLQAARCIVTLPTTVLSGSQPWR